MVTRIEKLTAPVDSQQHDSWHVVWGETSKKTEKTEKEWNYDWLLELLDACLPAVGCKRADVTTNISHSYTFPRFLDEAAEESVTQSHVKKQDDDDDEEEDDDDLGFDFGFDFGGQDPKDVQPKEVKPVITQPVMVTPVPVPVPVLEPVVVVVPSAPEAVPPPPPPPRRTAKELKAEEIQKQLAEKRAARLASISSSSKPTVTVKSTVKPVAVAVAVAVAAPAAVTTRKKGGVLNSRGDKKQGARGICVPDDDQDDTCADDVDNSE
jgi:hypothetical protein